MAYQLYGTYASGFGFGNAPGIGPFLKLPTTALTGSNSGACAQLLYTARVGYQLLSPSSGLSNGSANFIPARIGRRCCLMAVAGSTGIGTNII